MVTHTHTHTYIHTRQRCAHAHRGLMIIMINESTEVQTLGVIRIQLIYSINVLSKYSSLISHVYGLKYINIYIYIYIYINIGKIRIIQQTREARYARQLVNATALGLAYPAARSYNTL